MSVRYERCTYCGNETSDWVDPDWAKGRICKPCESKFEPLSIADLRTENTKLKEENYTGVLIDRLNELVRENRKFFIMECCDGPTAADLIQQIHSDFNQLKESRNRLEECEKALAEMFDLVESQVLVRNTKHDADFKAFTTQALKITVALKVASDVLAARKALEGKG